MLGCGGGGSNSPNPQPVTSAPPAVPVTPPPACSTTVAEGPFELVWPAASWATSTPAAQGLCPDDLEDAAEYAFADGNGTGAVLIIKNGYLVFDRYAEDRTDEDLVTSWSVAKSIASVLMGLAIDDTRISGLEQSVGDFVAEWQEGDKANITIDHMMTLRTALEEPDAGAIYGAENQLAISVDRDLVGTPGEQHVGYSNADVMVAGEVLEQAVGLNAQDYFDIKLGQTIGLNGEWWSDEMGHVLTYCCMDAIPVEFARFGLLMARNGSWNNEQLIPVDWIETSTLPAREDFIYRYYWWPVARGGYGAFGLQGQMIVIYPEYDLVVLRFTLYTRQGDGRTVRTPTNYHDTPAPENFDNGEFLRLARESVPS